MDLSQAYQTLGVTPGAIREQIKQAFREMLMVWHPDRFPPDSSVYAKAVEQTKSINAAYEFLKGHNPSQTPPPSRSAQPEQPRQSASNARTYNEQELLHLIISGPAYFLKFAPSWVLTTLSVVFVLLMLTVAATVIVSEENGVVIGILCLAMAGFLPFAINIISFAPKHSFHCPRCNADIRVMRWPETFQQWLFGGWTCKRCAATLDAKGKIVC